MNDNNKKDIRSTFPPNLQFFSTMEVAIIMGASRKTVISWINEGRLPAFRMGPNNRLIRVRRQDLEAFIADTALNQRPYRTLLRKYGGDQVALLRDLIATTGTPSPRARRSSDTSARRAPGFTVDGKKLPNAM